MQMCGSVLFFPTKEQNSKSNKEIDYNQDKISFSHLTFHVMIQFMRKKAMVWIFMLHWSVVLQQRKRTRDPFWIIEITLHKFYCHEWRDVYCSYCGGVSHAWDLTEIEWFIVLDHKSGGTFTTVSRVNILKGWWQIVLMLQKKGKEVIDGGWYDV